MSLEGLLVTVILMSVTLLLIVAPLLRRAEAPAALIDKQRQRLQLYYERVLSAVRDLDEDHALGKLNDDDYQRDRDLWTQRGIVVLKAIDSLDAAAPVLRSTRIEDAAVDRAIDDAVEAAIRAYRETMQA